MQFILLGTGRATIIMFITRLTAYFQDNLGKNGLPFWCRLSKAAPER